MSKEIVGYRLSPQQQHLWLLQQRERGRAYRAQCAILIEGGLDTNILKTAIETVIHRHEILRTSFHILPGALMPVQVIAQSGRPAFDECDLSQCDPPDQETAIEALLQRMSQPPFDFEPDSLLAFSLARLWPYTHVLCIRLPALCADLATFKNLVREIGDSYAAALRNEALADAAMQYADVANWQNELLESQEAEPERQYWRRQQLTDLLALPLPLEQPSLEDPGFEPRMIRSTIQPRVRERIEALVHQYQSSTSAFLLACWQVLLWRLTGQSDIVVGTAYDGRNYEGLEEVLGLFARYLPVRCHLPDNAQFNQILQQAHEATREISEWQEYFSWDYITGSSAAQTPPFFPVCFEFEEQAAKYSVADIAVSIHSHLVCIDRFKLKLAGVQREDGLIVEFHYDSNLFCAEDINRLAGQFRMLIESIFKTPGAPISALEILTEAERQQLLVEFNNTHADYPHDKCLHQLFEAQVERTPDHVAAVFEGQRLSYAELNARANQLAHHLQRFGVGPEALVGIFMERSLEMVIGLLAVLKAGAAYVPLDPEYPKERVTFMLEDAHVPVLLTQRHLVAGLMEDRRSNREDEPSSSSLDPRIQVVCLDTDGEAIAQNSVENIATQVAPENLMYVIYTSGSTGQPKGVMVSHRGISNHMAWMQRTYHQSEADCLMHRTPFSFDGSVWELWWPLLVGGRLVIARPGWHKDGAYLVRLISEQKITAVEFVPSMLNVFLNEEGLDTCDSLRHVICGGEALSVDLVERFFARLNAELHNQYGPTEASIDATFRTCQRGSDHLLVPIGRPIDNTQVYVLAERLEPAPIGVPGELYIGGVGLARGYLNRPELTAERFIPNPFSQQPGARLYKTGDLVRYRTDGNIDYLGRLDYQVKIRGYRIELGEIEAVLAQHPAVRETVVLVREDVPDDKRLVAYLVTDEKPAPTISELRSFLQEKLPEYMLPSAFVMLDALPLTPVGKVDRRALPAPDQARPQLAKAFVPPRTKVEHLLATMWQDMLGIETVGIYDNFFELGGNSIKAAIFINKLQQELGELIYVVALFDAPSIADLAVYVQEHYPAAVAKMLGAESVDSFQFHEGIAAVSQGEKVDELKVAQIRQLIRPLPSRQQDERASPAKNPPAIFILSPPRSGSTLLRVMLAGNPQLFAPPELELLSFNRLEERKAALSGRNSFWLEGTIRAIMEIKGCTAEPAQRIMEDCESQRLTTKAFYRWLQEWIGDRLLVDKTPSYTLDMEILKRAEADFEEALYIHLLRHPYGVIRSFEEAKLDQVFFRYEHSFSTRELAELIWVMSHQNILEFLQSVPDHRQLQVRFEELVNQPRPVLQKICEFLCLEFHPDMLQPYKNTEKKMTNGIHPLAKMLGDVKFHEHTRIDSTVAERWRKDYAVEFLGDVTWQVAESLGYKRVAESREEIEPRGAVSTRINQHRSSAAVVQQATPEPSTETSHHRANSPRWSALARIQPNGSKPPFFCIHAAGGHVLGYTSLARHLGADQPFYGLQAPGLDGEQEPCGRIEDMAAHYIEALRTVQPDGPFLLGGWSMGGVVAYEMAQQLHAQGQSVRRLVLLDSRAATVGEAPPPQDEITHLVGFALHLGLSLDHLTISWDQLHQLEPDDQLAYVLQQAGRANLVPPDIGLAQVQRLYRLFKTNVQAIQRYIPQAYPGRVTLFQADEPVGEAPQDSTLGWGQLAAGGVEIHVTPGNHYTMIREPHVQALAQRLRACLARAQ
jgi:amino acid adenylation domain-containing protein